MINNNGIDVSVNSEMMDNEENSEIVDTKCKVGSWYDLCSNERKEHLRREANQTPIRKFEKLAKATTNLIE